MKRLVLFGEGEGDEAALPILVARLIQEKNATGFLFVDKNVIRTGSASGLVRRNQQTGRPDYTEWLRMLKVAFLRRDVGGVLAVFDGDIPALPPGSPGAFCAATAAQAMATAAASTGAGSLFSLAVVFACVEYETWLIAGIESLAGKENQDGRTVVPKGTTFPPGDRECHGKRWLISNCVGYRPTRDQAEFTRLLDLQAVRTRNLRSFTRLDHAIDQLVEAIRQGSPVATP